MLNKKILTFIIPIYNIKKEWVFKSIDSCISIMIDTNDVEIIVIDNGSTNNIYEELEKRYLNSKIILKRIKINHGKPRATNLGVSIASGKYIQILDPDDWIDYDGAIKLLEKLKVFDFEIAFLNYRYYRQSKDKFRDRIIYKTKKPYLLFNDVPKFLWHFDTNTILSRDFLLKNNFKIPDTLKFYEDVYINQWCLSKAKKVGFINNIIYNYRTNLGGNNVSSTSSLLKNFDWYNSLIFELLKLDFSNSLTKKHMAWFVSLQLLTYVFWNSYLDGKRMFPYKYHKKILLKIKSENPLFYKMLKSKKIKYWTIFEPAIWFGYNPLIWIGAKVVVKFRK